MTAESDYFVVIRAAGPGWIRGRPLDEQSGWPEHAAFIDALVDAGFVVLGGPLHGAGPQGMLVVRAGDEAAVHRELAADPWSPTGVLETARVARWELRLGELPRSRPPATGGG